MFHTENHILQAIFSLSCVRSCLFLVTHTLHLSHRNHLHVINVHALLPKHTIRSPDSSMMLIWGEKKKNLAASVKLIHDQLIQLFMIKDFYIVRTQLWLLIVVSVEMYLPFVINKPETWRITCVLSECHIQAVWQNQVRIAEENICHYWTEALPSACNMINHNSISVIDCTGCAWGRE